MHINKNHEVVVNEDDVIDLIYKGKKIRHIVVSDSSWVSRFNRMSELFDIPQNLTFDTESDKDPDEFIADCVGENGWYLPDEYINFDIHSDLISKCSTEEQVARVEMEYEEFEKRNMIPVLKFLRYFIDVMRKEKLIWGVGRGSSVASYILYLMDIHKVDSLKYDIPINEFLK